MRRLLIREYQNGDGSVLPVLYSPAFEQGANACRADGGAAETDRPQFLHLFTTREGGVSTGPYRSMNLGFRRGDDEANVTENFRRIATVCGIPTDRFVLSQQTHTVNVRQVTAEDAGKGIVRERDYTDVDALITDEKELALVIYVADCVPVLFADPVHHAVGAAHSGWRGTAGQIVWKTLAKMHAAYGTRPEDVYTVIGPCICGDCYEVGPEVAEAFGFDANILRKGRDDRYQLDLAEANRRILLDAGCSEEKMTVTDICTRCNKEFLFSHRGQGPVRGNLAGIIMMK